MQIEFHKTNNFNASHCSLENFQLCIIKIISKGKSCERKDNEAFYDVDDTLLWVLYIFC